MKSETLEVIKSAAVVTPSGASELIITIVLIVFGAFFYALSGFAFVRLLCPPYSSIAGKIFCGILWPLMLPLSAGHEVGYARLEKNIINSDDVGDASSFSGCSKPPEPPKARVIKEGESLPLQILMCFLIGSMFGGLFVIAVLSCLPV